MKCLLVFDHLNDVVYTKYNRKFATHLNSFAKVQGLVETNENQTNTRLSPDVIIQIFSPIITSQRIMTCQFGNSYMSIECKNGLTLTFEEYMGYLFVCIGNDEVVKLKRYLSMCVTITRYVCGPDVSQLRNNSSLVSKLIDSWVYLSNNDQTVFVEAVEQLMINSDLSLATLQALQESVEKLSHSVDRLKMHAMVLVQNKFLALYSSQNAKTLSPTDILFMSVLCESHNTNRKDSNEAESETDSEEEFYSPSESPVDNKPPDIPVETVHSHQILLAGNEYIPKCIPHMVHISRIAEGVNLIYLLEVGNAIVATSLYEAFLHLHVMQTVQIQHDIETLKPAFENLDLAMKRLCDGLKKVKIGCVEVSYKQLLKRWDFIRKKYMEFIKTASDQALLSAETAVISLLDNLKEILSLTSLDKSLLTSSQAHIPSAATVVKERLLTFYDFLRVKAIRNFTLGSRDSLTINKYLEEFPGLVHFLYVDRTTHRVTAPSLDFSSEETNNLTKEKIWAMINFARNHLQEGHLSIMWKDTTFNYAYFLWFEDMTGSPMKPVIFPTNASKVLPQPGILCGDFYEKLKEICFPKIPPAKIRCYELYCIHLGLATASLVLEHTRRLAATIWELRGHPHHSIDLL